MSGGMERIGATDENGTTDPDRAEFFENVPTNALDVALWIESDRMGHLLGSIDQGRLDTQRGVVQNEKRQDENQPYGVTRELIAKGTAPAGHPYSWTTIGSMEDLNAASLDDVKTWFKTFYGAANVALVLAGDIDSDTALKKTERYFGDIPAGPPVARYHKWIPHLVGTRRETVSGRVPQARIYKLWNIPPYGEADSIGLELVSDVLASGKTSRLYKRLVYDEQIATDVAAYAWTAEISGLFGIEVTARPGGDLAKTEKAIDEEVARFLDAGPTQAELQRAQAQELAGFVRSIERIGGFGGKSDILAMNETYRGSPDFYQTILIQGRRLSGLLQRGPVHPDVHPRRSPRCLRRCPPKSVVPRIGFSTASKGENRRDSARENGAARHGIAGFPAHPLRQTARLRQSPDRLRHRGVRRKADPGRPSEIP
jgi:zinc protease